MVYSGPKLYEYKEFSELDVDFLNLTKVVKLLFRKRLEGHFLQWILITAALTTNQLISLQESLFGFSPEVMFQSPIQALPKPQTYMHH